MDGAAKAYDSLRWTEQLVTPFLHEGLLALALEEPRKRPKEMDHDQLFVQLVSEARAAKEMKNNDATLLRVQAAAAQPEHLVVCL